MKNQLQFGAQVLRVKLDKFVTLKSLSNIHFPIAL